MSDQDIQDLFFMQRAFACAQPYMGLTAPNPAVGAVVVKAGVIIGQGAHEAAGLAHAEVNALAMCDDPAGATVYVTLEPCCHFGKTPPCTQAIIQSGIARVVYGYADPNPIVKGKGVQALQAANISCKYLALPEITQMYRGYQQYTVNHLPRVHVKLAVSEDGCIAKSQGKPASITGPLAAQYTHEQRQACHAVLTSIATIINDDPQLNVRLLNVPQAKPVYVLDSQLRMPLTARIFDTAAEVIVLHAESADDAQRQALQSKGARCVAVADSAKGLDLPQVLQVIAADGVHDLWVEVGAQVFAALYQARLIDRLLLMVGSNRLGLDALPAQVSPCCGDGQKVDVQVKALGADVLFSLDMTA